MIKIQKQKKTPIGVEMLRELAVQGHRIFTLNEARSAAGIVGLDHRYVIEALSHLKRQGWIRGVKRGLYAFTVESGMSAPPHEFEIAQAIAPGSVISHWTAMRYHGVTQQVPSIVYSTLPLGHKQLSELGSFYFICAKGKCVFGSQSVWIDDSRIEMTDLEKTLLDGLWHPEYCGGFQEVLDGFRVSLDRLNYERIVEYALLMGPVIAKRLGWVLDYLGTSADILEPLQKCEMNGPRKLDASSAAGGRYCGKWQLQENI